MRQSPLNKLIVPIKTALVSAVLLLPFFIISCTKENRQPLDNTPAFNPSGPATLSSIQSDVIVLGCAVSGCHDNRATPAANMNLTSADNTYNAFVNRISQQVPSLKVVTPFDFANSYLIHKIDGTHLTVGGIGVQMPQYAAALPKGQRDRIVQWVLDGAPKN